jgi:dTDP-L-rhamnose 4-epimerase
MSRETVLITGGAGFIGSHLGDALLRAGYRVRALDCLLPQVHGSGMQRPSYLDPGIELVVGDVRDTALLREVLSGVDAVFHFAARVGVGQSMYQISEYVDTNARGTAVLMQALAEQPVRRLVVASSMSIYGEGLYRSSRGVEEHVTRDLAELKCGRWDPRGSDGELLTPLPTRESKPAALASVYALSKYDQERLCLMLGEAYRIPTVALRFFNVYGTRQALSNPYTGVLAIFASRLLNRKAPSIFEDGRQRRDFVHVSDVVQACMGALRSDAAGVAVNVGSGVSYTVLEVARAMADAIGGRQPFPEITGSYRVGDVRHCFADVSLARELLGYQPAVALSDGLKELAAWLSTQSAVDRVDEMRAQLGARGLTL